MWHQFQITQVVTPTCHHYCLLVLQNLLHNKVASLLNIEKPLYLFFSIYYKIHSIVAPAMIPEKKKNASQVELLESSVSIKSSYQIHFTIFKLMSLKNPIRCLPCMPNQFATCHHPVNTLFPATICLQPYGLPPSPFTSFSKVFIW